MRSDVTMAMRPSSRDTTAETAGWFPAPRLRWRVVRGLFAGAVVLAVVAAVVVAVPRRHHDAVPAADYRGELGAARAAAPYQVVVPRDVPPAWRPVTVRVSGTGGGIVTWHLEFRTADGRRVALIQRNAQTNATADRFVDAVGSNGTVAGRQRVGDAWWTRRYRQDKEQRSLVRRARGSTVVVTGTVSFAVLGELAGSLGPPPR